MTATPGGTWGTAVWDGSCWDRYQSGTRIGMNVLSTVMKNLITQATPNVQTIGTTILLDGVDVENATNTLFVSGADIPIPYAQVVIAAPSLPDVVVDVTTLTIEVTMTTQNGIEFSAVVFDGIVSSNTPYAGVESQSTVLVAKHFANAAMQAEPLHSYDHMIDADPNYAGEWPADETAQEIVEREIADAGLTGIIDMTDFSPDTPETSWLPPTTRLDLIRDLISGQTVAWFGLTPQGTVLVSQADSFPTPIWTIGRNALENFDVIDESRNRWNQITAAGNEWEYDEDEQEWVATPITATYDDATDQTIRGVISGDGPTSIFLNNETDLLTLAESVTKTSQLKQVSLSWPFNPFIGLFDTILVEQPDSSFATVKIVGLETQISWDGKRSGAWTRVTGVLEP